jgi:RecA-family ATPase
MKMAAVQAEPDTNQIERFIKTITRRWNELDGSPVIEVRCIGQSGGVNVARFSTDKFFLGEAIDHIKSMNAAKQNVYMVINPVDGTKRVEAGKAATDADILAATYCFADGDDANGMKNILEFAGPRFTMSVKTGTEPHTRGHAYWELEEPVYNLDAWRGVQRAIASRLETDQVVVNPSRIMRVAGTVSWPNAKKQARGYVSELVTMRTEFSDDREPIGFERLVQVFGSNAAPKPAAEGMFNIDLGQQAMDRALAEQSIMAGQDWHHNIVRLVGSYVSRGLTDGEIHSLTDKFTQGGYSADDTQREVQTAIDGARAKGWTPQPDPVVAMMAAQIPQADYQEPDEVQKVMTAARKEIGLTYPTLLTEFDEMLLPRRHWLYGTAYIRGYISVLASAGGVGKTSMTIVEALSVATGRPLLGETVHEQTNVWLVNLEDPRSELLMRVLATMKHYKIKKEDVKGKFFMDGEDDIKMVMAAEGRDGLVTNDALADYVRDKIISENIGLVIIDPFVSVSQVNENSNTSVQVVVAMFRAIARQANCSLELVHHTRKGNGEDATVDSIRGAGSLISAARVARVINKITFEEAMQLGFPEDQCSGIFRVDDAKQNLAAATDRSVYRRIIGVQIDNGEWVGVCTSIELPDAWDGVQPKHAMLVQQIVGKQADSDPFRESVQSKQWVGLAVAEVLKLDADDASDKVRIKTIVKSWIKTDVLRIETTMDERRKREVPIVVVGKWVTREEAGL